MSKIHDDLNIILDGVSPFSVGSDTYTWIDGADYSTIWDIPIVGDDPGQSYDVDIHFDGQDWLVGNLMSIRGSAIDTITMSGVTPDKSTAIYELEVQAQTSTYLDFTSVNVWRLYAWFSDSDNTVLTGWNVMQDLYLAGGDDTVVTNTTYIEHLFTGPGTDTVTLGWSEPLGLDQRAASN